MTDPRLDIPSTASLLAFEATARLGSVTRAAEELRTSQSTVSRRIHSLETRLGFSLFRRRGRGTVLTDAGEDYYAAVTSSLQTLHVASQRPYPLGNVLTIACTHDIINCLLSPVYPELRRSLEGHTNLRVIGCEFDMLPVFLAAGINIYFEYSATPVRGNAVKILDEEIIPVASPAFVERYGRILAKHPRRWVGVPRLEYVIRNQRWATWPTWFQAYGCAVPEAPVECFDNYQFTLLAATDGQGLALGWNGFANDHIKSGRLVQIGQKWLTTSSALYAVSSRSGENNPHVMSCLESIAQLTGSMVAKNRV